jgi:hypothetical protein
MFKDAKQYAVAMLNECEGDKSAALSMLFDAARIYPQVPASFFRDAFIALKAY